MTPLDHMAARVSTDPWFLAHALAAYQIATGLTDDELAACLGCDLVGLTRLRLCRTPADAGEVQAIAEGIGCDVGVLGEVVGV